MPRIDDIVKKSPKKFQKKAYRAWNFNELASDDEKEPTETKKKVSEKKIKKNVGLEQPVKKIKPLSSDLIDSSPSVEQTIVKEEVVASKNSKPISVHERTYTQAFTEEHEYESLHQRLSRLTGHQKKIFFYVAERCISRNGDSGPITMAIFKELINSSSDMARLSFKRLIERNLLIRNQGKTGRHGYSIFSLPEDVYKATFEFISFSERSMLNVQPASVTPIQQHSVVDPSWNLWKTIDYSMLEEISFSETQLKQLMDKTTPDAVQESLNHFSYGLEHNPKLKSYTDPLNVLMGVLRKGQMWIEKGYRAPKEIAQEQLLEQRKAATKREKELSDKAYDLAFNDWHGNLSSDETKKIFDSVSSEFKSAPKKVQLKNYFQQRVWNSLKSEYLIEGTKSK